ncbi:MAG: DUF3417 domain-containing protein, partial [Candidatus Amulumruptor caecigallinarius]|nr:DUF3417 domain-containing protein [Candidatus Amulumruptor caecigallinarius]
NGVLNFSVLDGWWYEGYRFDEKAGWALTDRRTFTDQAQQDRLDAATIYSMLENEIVPLYFAKNSLGYSPEWIQYIKRSVGHIAPHFTMQRMIEDYIERFYEPEAKRSKKLGAHDYALAREIVAWKEKVAAAWPGVHVTDFKREELNGPTLVGTKVHNEVTVDTNGLGKDLMVEKVVYRTEGNDEKLWKREDFKVAKQEGNLVTYTLDEKVMDPGQFKVGFRIYPKNALLPHRQDFAYVKWL